MYVKDLDIFVTVHLLEDTPPVLSRGQVCDVRCISCEWTGGQKPHLIKNFKKYHATWRTTCLLSFPVCRVKLPVPVRQFRQLLLHHGTPREPIPLRHQLKSFFLTKKKTKQERSLARRTPSLDLRNKRRNVGTERHLS